MTVSVKSLQKQLIAAVAMVLVAMIALGSSTYAWFAQNNKVTATGMNVQATTSKNLIISTTSSMNDDEGTTKAATFSTAKTLSPASVQTLAGSQTFYKNTDSTGVGFSTGKGTAGTVFAATSGDDIISSANASTINSGYVVKYTYYIRVAGTDSDTMTNLYVSNITANESATKEIDKALRIGVVCGSKGFIYAPVSGATTTYNAVKAAGTVATVETGIYKDASSNALNASTTALTTYTDGSILADTVTSTAYQTVDVYVWYEGEDGSCTSEKAIDTTNIAISLEFTATAA